jgi:hypothetical protein
MPARLAGIHICLPIGDRDVDGRDKPGHDEAALARPSFIISQETPMTYPGWAIAIARNAARCAGRRHRGTWPLRNDL